MSSLLKKVSLLLFTGMLFLLQIIFFQQAIAKKLVIGMSFQELNNEYFVVMKNSLEDAAKDLGAKVYIADAHHDVLKQVNDVEDMLQKGIDILLINPTDSVGIQPAVISAHQAGVTVVAVDAQAHGPIDAFVGSENYDAGLQAGEYLAKYLNGKGKVAILDGIPVVPILERVRGFEDAMKKYPGIQIINRQNGKQERVTSLNVTENMLQSAPDLAGIFSVNDTGALGALVAIKSSKSNVKLVSVDGQSEAVKEIEKGNSPFIATVAQFPRDEIRIALGIALAHHWGAEVPKSIPVKVKLIDQDNAKGFSW